MRTRLVVVALVLVPTVLATAVILAWTGWSGARDHRELGRLAAQVGQERAITEAVSRLSQEIGFAVVVGRVPDRRLPEVLGPYARSGRSLAGSSDAMRAIMGQADRLGAAALTRLEASGFPVTPAIRRALAPMTAGERRAVAAGRAAGVLPWGVYGDALTTLQAGVADAQSQGRAAIDELVRRSQEPPLWRQPHFVALAFGLLALAALAASAAGWLVSRRVHRAEGERDRERGRAEALERRNERLRHAVGASRRLAAGADLASVTRAVADETRDLLGAHTAAVFLLDDDGDAAAPVACSGALEAGTVPAHAGVLGRAMDSALPSRAVTVDDPAFPAAGGPVAVLAAPLVAGRRVTGAIVVATPAGDLADDEDQALLQLVALPAATAIEAARAHDSAARLAHTDALTGVANRRRLDGDLEELAGAGDEPVAFLMIDVDHFKRYNDTHGHPAGDVLLRTVADLVRGSVREGDVVYRFGGEEFAVLLPGAGDDAARAVAGRIRDAVAAHDFPGGVTQPGGRVTVSVGGTRSARGGDPAALVGAADGALYEAKRAGRDRVVFAA
ncbi:MAG: sensor domain-containing diguanylate cyclase [Actinomycetota bacterium]